VATQPTRARTFEEYVRELDDRLRVLEHRTFLVLGVPPNAYLLEVNAAGELVATNTTTGTATTVALP
jgi:hypothetical protein